MSNYFYDVFGKLIVSEHMTDIPDIQLRGVNEITNRLTINPLKYV